MSINTEKQLFTYSEMEATHMVSPHPLTELEITGRPC